MKSNHRFLSTLLLCLPLLCVSLLWDRLPERIAIHFGNDGQPDQLITRQEWFGTLTNVMVALVLIRSVIIAVLSRRMASQEPHFVRLYLFSAGFVSAVLGLVILRAFYQSSAYTDYLPVLMALSGAGLVYWMMIPRSPVTDEAAEPSPPPRQVSAAEQIRSLSRLVVIRVNVLAALLMLFARPADRWAIGILANMLAFIALTLIAAVIRRQSM